MNSHVRQSFDPLPGFLNSATIGIPPRDAVEKFEHILRDWSRGSLEPADFEADVTRSRLAWAALAGVDPSWVAIGPAVSSFVGVVAASLSSGSEVLVASGDFTSVLFPFLAQQPRGVRVREVALGDLVNEVSEETSLVAVSSVQSSDGTVLDLDGLVASAKLVGAQVLVDTTQSCGWLPLDCSKVDYAVCGAYKWLLCPRGTAFMSIRPERFEQIVPQAANWYAGEDIWTSVYGSPLRLASSARRYDVSPAWFNWPSAAISLELLVAEGLSAIWEHDVALANAFLEKMGEPQGNSAIVTIESHDAAERLEAAGVRTAVRAGRVRASFHLYNEMSDVDLAVDALSQVRAL